MDFNPYLAQWLSRMFFTAGRKSDRYMTVATVQRISELKLAFPPIFKVVLNAFVPKIRHLCFKPHCSILNRWW